MTGMLPTTYPRKGEGEEGGGRGERPGKKATAGYYLYYEYQGRLGRGLRRQCAHLFRPEVGKEGGKKRKRGVESVSQCGARREKEDNISIYVSLNETFR